MYFWSTFHSHFFILNYKVCSAEIDASVTFF